ncbi:hypothetical protein POM88_000778 [Heracleum sosnowskyi]|uniref:Uncharacterized protein n=1 Tax=Heracleum sosnowskyi TaxID=360622 RepID=A0AAD8JDM8_9APIA|nr:hypothetical protein POM88_000778 [Heracleum sosnowskyi]
MLDICQSISDIDVVFVIHKYRDSQGKLKGNYRMLLSTTLEITLIIKSLYELGEMGRVIAVLANTFVSGPTMPDDMLSQCRPNLWNEVAAPYLDSGMSRCPDQFLAPGTKVTYLNSDTDLKVGSYCYPEIQRFSRQIIGKLSYAAEKNSSNYAAQ